MRNVRWLAVLLAVLLGGCGNDGGLDTTAADVELGATAPESESEARGSEESLAEGNNSDDPADAENAGEDEPSDETTTTVDPTTTTQATTTTSAPTTTAAAEPPPDRTGSGIRFGNLLGLDLDSTETDWGLTQNRYDGELRWSTVSIWDYYRTEGQVIAVSGEPARSGCDDPGAERWVKKIPFESIQVGSSFCVETDEGGRAWVKFIEFNDAEDSRGEAVVDISYWKE